VAAKKKKRGFASMDPEEHRKIAAAGGKAAHEAGVAHRMTPKEAAKAGRKGGKRLARDREHMRLIGQRGGLSRGKSKTTTPSKVKQRRKRKKAA
jgi:uncharacterized protein